jgi:hypothetical protein
MHDQRITGDHPYQVRKEDGLRRGQLQGSVDLWHVWDRNSNTSDTKGSANDWDRCAGLDEGKLARSQEVNNEQLSRDHQFAFQFCRI